jgi:DNA-binding transcriptional LysR family regulator
MADDAFTVLPLFPGRSPYRRHRQPRTGSAAPTIEESLERVALGTGVFVLPVGLADFYRRDDISYVPLQDVAARMVALAYHKHRTMPELGQFADLVTIMLTSVTLE